jgi:hypothetical protein
MFVAIVGWSCFRLWLVSIGLHIRWFKIIKLILTCLFFKKRKRKEQFILSFYVAISSINNIDEVIRNWHQTRCLISEKFVIYHFLLKDLFQLGGGRTETNMFPEVDSTWKVCENFLPFSNPDLHTFNANTCMFYCPPVGIFFPSIVCVELHKPTSLQHKIQKGNVFGVVCILHF